MTKEEPQSYDYFALNNIYAKETSDNTKIRAELRLSTRWRVVGKDVEMVDGERSDECPEHKAVSAAELKNRDKVSRGKVDIYVTASPKQFYLCPNCKHSCKPMCYERRIFHHLPEQGCECNIIARIPKLECKHCGGTPQVPFPLAEPHVRFTKDLAEEVICGLIHRNKTTVARDNYISTDIVASIVEHYMRGGLIEQDLSDTTGVYLDETQFGQGQDYISIFINQRRKVIFVCEGHGKDVLELFCDHLIIHGGDPDNIRFFSADMSSAYEAGIKEHFKNAILIWDRFHLTSSTNDAVNDVRKRTLKRAAGEKLSGVKYVVLKHFQNQTPNQEEKMEQIRLVNPELAIAFDMKEVFSQIILDKDRQSMEAMLKWWIQWVREEGPEELVKKADRFEEKMDRILDWAIFPVSNSVAEGINKNIQDTRRQACGYTNLKNFAYMIFIRQSEIVFRF